MYRFEVALLVEEKLGPDLGGIVMMFLKEDPVPYVWHVEETPSPWDHEALVWCDPQAMVNLPLFAP